MTEKTEGYTLTRAEAYQLIDGERAYQTSRWGHHKHGAGAFLTYLWNYYRVMEAVDSTVDADGPAHDAAKDAMRKFAALCVACMEENGVVFRGQEPLTGPRLRTTIYQAIDQERDYQEGLGGDRAQRPQGKRRLHQFSEFLTMLRHYLTQADAAWTGKAGQVAALDVIRKLAAIAVRGMEVHGAPARQI